MKVLENDLMGAMKTAPPGETDRVVKLCIWVVMELPSSAYGSSNAMWRWIRQGGELNHK
jgi:hypothetical protein